MTPDQPIDASESIQDSADTGTERRYSADEVGSILRRAIEFMADAQLADASEGVTLSQIQEVASRAGIAAEQVAEAAEVTFGPIAGPSEPVTVFLGLVAADMAEAREAVKNQLEADGHTVLPEQTPELESAVELQQAVEADLARSRLAVHLIGSVVGKKPTPPPDIAERPLLQIQTDAAAERLSNGSLERIIWVPGELDPDELPPKQLAFIEGLEAESASGKSELLRTSLEELKSHLQRRLGVAATAGQEVTGAGLMVFLVHDKADLDATQPLEDFLEVEKGVAVEKPALEGQPEDIELVFEDKADRCDAAIIYYGHANDAWVKANLIRLRKKLAEREGFRGGAVFLGAPFGGEKLRYDIQQDLKDMFELLESDQSLDTAALEEFLQRLAEAESARSE